MTLSVSNAEVAALLGLDRPTGQGSSPSPWCYLDVRTTQEFGTGHIPGAFNIPVKLGTLAGLTDNPAFLDTVRCAFEQTFPLIIGCRTGSRAQVAVALLTSVGFDTLRLHGVSFAGSRDSFGRLTPGWQEAGYAVSYDTLPGRSYSELVYARTSNGR